MTSAKFPELVVDTTHDDAQVREILEDPDAYYSKRWAQARQEAADQVTRERLAGRPRYLRRRECV